MANDKPKQPWVVGLRRGCKKVCLAKFNETFLYAGENHIYDPAMVKELLLRPSSVDITPEKAQEAVDLGYVEAEEAAAMGYQIVIGHDADGRPIYAEARNDTPVISVNSMPDFPRWTQAALIDYCEKNGIVAPRGWGHTELADACRKHAEAETAKRLEAEAPKAKPEPVKVEFKEPEPEPEPKPKPAPKPKRRGKKK